MLFLLFDSVIKLLVIPPVVGSFLEPRVVSRIRSRADLGRVAAAPVPLQYPHRAGAAPARHTPGGM